MIPACFNRQLFVVKNALTFSRTELSQFVQLFVQSIVIARVVVQILIQELQTDEEEEEEEEEDHLTRSSLRRSSSR
jgi:hypothetical protein